MRQKKTKTQETQNPPAAPAQAGVSAGQPAKPALPAQAGVSASDPTKPALPATPPQGGAV